MRWCEVVVGWLGIVVRFVVGVVVSVVGDRDFLKSGSHEVTLQIKTREN